MPYILLCDLSLECIQKSATIPNECSKVHDSKKNVNKQKQQATHRNGMHQTSAISCPQHRVPLSGHGRPQRRTLHSKSNAELLSVPYHSGSLCLRFKPPWQHTARSTHYSGTWNFRAYVIVSTALARHVAREG